MADEASRKNHADLAEAERAFYRIPTDERRAALVALLSVDPDCQCSLHRGLRKRKLVI